MKKVLIAEELYAALRSQDSFLNRSGIQVFVASSNDELLNLHRTKRADLIITQLDLPGMSTEETAARIREDAHMPKAPLLLICHNTRSAVEQAGRCSAAAVVLRPVNPLVLLARAQQLLAIAWRETYRAAVSVVVDGRAGNDMFLCRSRDISVSGMLLETEKLLDQGARISCSFYLPDSAQIQATAEVVRTVKPPERGAPCQYGLKFLQMNPDHRRSLELFIHSRSLHSSGA